MTSASLTATFRRRVSEGVYVVALLNDDLTWRVEVTDSASRPVSIETRKAALETVMGELSSLRQHIWKVELGK